MWYYIGWQLHVTKQQKEKRIKAKGMDYSDQVYTHIL